MFTGALALVALQAVLSSDRSAGRVGDMFSHVADLARRALDPSVAAIPDLRGGSPESDKPAAARQPRQQPDDEETPRHPKPKDVPDWMPKDPSKLPIT